MNARLFSSWRRFDNSFVRFLLVGVVNTVAGMGIMYLLLNAFDAGYWLSTFAGNTVGAVISYILNRSFSFRSRVHWFGGFLRFALVVIVCYIISYGLSLWLLEHFVVWLAGAGESGADRRLIHNLAILAGNGIYTILNYTGHRLFTFRDSLPARRRG